MINNKRGNSEPCALAIASHRRSEESPEFLAIGHFVHDVTKDGLILGGSASYSTIAARSLNVRAGAVTSVGRDFLHYHRFDRIPIALVDGSSPDVGTTTFHNVYEKGVRTQTVKNVSLIIRPEHIPAEWLSADIVYLCPVANEVDPCIVHSFPDSIIGASPQGWLRQWDADGRVTPRRWVDAEKVLPYIDALIMSEEDVAPFPEVVEEYRQLVKAMVLTRGENGSRLFYDGRVVDFPAFRVNVVDPTGAGDVFAAAFLIRYRQTRDLHDASIFANCAASFIVEKPGTEGIPSIDQVYSRLKSSC